MLAKGSLLALSVAGCATMPRTSVRAIGVDDYCTPPGTPPRVRVTLAPVASVDFSAALRAHYSGRALAMAYAAGAMPDLDAMESAIESGPPDANALRTHVDRVLQRVQLAHQQGEAMVAELACESQRTRQSREFLAGHETSAVRALTVASIIVGGASAVTLGFIGRYAGGSVAEEVVGIAGGVASAGLGASTFLVHEHRWFTHERNLLADIWTGPARSSLYPPVVWYYLTQREFSNSGERPIRENMVRRWARFEHLSHRSDIERARREALLFGRGGLYAVDDLIVRAALLEQTSSAVALMDQEVDRLAREVLDRVDALRGASAAP